MNPEEMKLPESDMSVAESMKVTLGKEWVIDNPWIRAKLSGDVLIAIYASQMKHLAERSRLESQLKGVEANFFGEVAQIVSKR